MITGSAFSAATSVRVLRPAPVALPIAGPLPPACEVEKNTGLDMVEVALLAHALHEDRPHHSAPADDADSQHDR